MSSYSEKTGDHLLGKASWASNFCWIWLILNYPYSQLLFTFEPIHVNPRFITCHDFIDSKQRDRIFGAFISTRVLFWAIDKLCGIQQQTINFLTVRYSCNIECMLVPLMPMLPQSHDISHDDLAKSVGAQHQWYAEQQLILNDFHEIRLGVKYNLYWIYHTIEKHLPLIELHCQKLNLVHRYTVVRLVQIESYKK